MLYTERVDMSLREHYIDSTKLYDSTNIFGIFTQGSQNYDMATKFSDVDSKCLLIPTVKDLVYNNPRISKTFIRDNDERIDFKDIRAYFDLCIKQNINFVEFLFAKEYIINENYTTFWEELLSIRELVAHINSYKMVKMIAGMAMEKKVALCHPYPSKIEILDKYGYDSKQLHHIFRLEDFARRYIDGEPFEKCLIPTDKDFLISIKTNETVYTLEEVKTLADESVKTIHNLYKSVSPMEDDDKTIETLQDILYRIILYKLKEEIHEY